MGIAIETRLIDYAKLGDNWTMHLGVQTSGGYAAASSAAVPSGTSSTTALASLMFYTD
jgi:hypothetical protein